MSDAMCLARALHEDVCRPAQLELALAWLAGTSESRAHEVHDALAQLGVPEPEAERRALAWLERAWLSAREDQPTRRLGLPPDFTPEQLRHRYRLLMRVFHPDRRPGGAAQARRISRAHAELRRGLAQPSTRRRARARLSAPPRGAPRFEAPERRRPRHAARRRKQSLVHAMLEPLRQGLDVERLRRRALWTIALVATLIVALSGWSRWRPDAPQRESVRASEMLR